MLSLSLSSLAYQELPEKCFVSLIWVSIFVATVLEVDRIVAAIDLDISPGWPSG